MTATAPGGDVRGFYLALGVQVPGWARSEAPVRCFVDSDAHQHQDRDASCSVNLESGAFNCHGCGAHGGAYDAALARGCSPREAIELMIAHGLTQRRPRTEDSRRSASPATARDMSPTSADRTTVRVRATLRAAPRHVATDWQPVFAVDGNQIEIWAEALGANRWLLARLRAERGWDERVLRELGVGFDGERITVPILDERGAPQGVLRLRIDPWQRPKVLAVPGTRLALIPRPAPEDRRVWLVEGPSDMLAARSAGLPALAVPGTHAWRTEWASELVGRRVTVVMDADRPGRQAAARIASDLEHQGAARVRILELAPSRDDGYDLSDWLRDGKHPRTPAARSYTRDEYRRMLATADRSGAASASRSAVRGSATSGLAAAVIDGGGGRSHGCARF